MTVRRPGGRAEPRDGAAGDLGLVLPTFPQYGSGVPDVAGLAARAEAAGATALWACDHLFWHGPTYECLTVCALAQASTVECRIGTAVLQLPLRAPASVARAAATLQATSRGRFVLGVGAGMHRGEYERAGVPFATRGRSLDAGIDAIRAAWSVGAGRYRQLPEVHRVPVWVGGSSTRAVARAARSGDGWMPIFLAPDELAAGNRALTTELAARGRPPRAVTRAALVFVSVGPERTAAREGRAWLASLYRLPERRFSRHLVAGDAHRCAEALGRVRASGAAHIAVSIAGDAAIEPFRELAAACDEMAAEEVI